MFKSDARLFLSALTNVEAAKSLIKKCQQKMTDCQLNNTNCYNVKSAIDKCKIDELYSKMEDVRDSLMHIDQEFADSYIKEIGKQFQPQSLDDSVIGNVEAGEYAKIIAQEKEYNRMLLYMLEKQEAAGQLDDNMRQQLLYQRELVAQYDIKDKMAGLDQLSDEYVELFMQCAEYDRRLIELMPGVSEDDKNRYLAQYDAQYTSNLNALLDAKANKLKREKDMKELEDLYDYKEDNSGLFHPFIESEIDELILDKKIEMGIATEDEIEYKNMGDFDKFLSKTCTFTVSTFTALYGVTEDIEDSIVLLGSAIGVCDKQWASEYIATDLSGNLYQGIQLSTGMNSQIAYGTWHTVGDIFGNAVGYVGLSFLPGGKVTTALTGGLAASGSSAERAFQSGATWEEATITAGVAGTLAGLSGYGVGGGITEGARTLEDVAYKTLLGTYVSIIEPSINPAVEYLTYASDIVDESGTQVYDNILDYYVDSGGLTNILLSMGVGAISSGIKSYSGYKRFRSVPVSACNELDNFFEQQRTKEFGYGPKQSIIDELLYDNTESDALLIRTAEQFDNVMNRLKDAGFCEQDALQIMKSINSVGACSYATVVGEVFSVFKDKSDEFEKIFGFPMYTTLSDGTKVLNSAELLEDLYVYANDVKNGGRLFEYNSSTNSMELKTDMYLISDANGLRSESVIILEDPVALDNAQVFLSGDAGKNSSLINAYLYSKSPDIDYVVVDTFKSNVTDFSTITPLTNEEIIGLQKNIKHSLEQGMQISLDYVQRLDSKYSVTMYSLDGGSDLNTRAWVSAGEKSSGHSVLVTGMTEHGVVVNSWGNKYLITFEDLKYTPFAITTATIKVK